MLLSLLIILPLCGIFILFMFNTEKKNNLLPVNKYTFLAIKDANKDPTIYKYPELDENYNFISDRVWISDVNNHIKKKINQEENEVNDITLKVIALVVTAAV